MLWLPRAIGDRSVDQMSGGYGVGSGVGVGVLAKTGVGDPVAAIVSVGRGVVVGTVIVEVGSGDDKDLHAVSTAKQTRVVIHR